MGILLGVLCAVIVTIVAYKKGALSISGVTAAIILGTGIYVLGGVITFALMMIFFVSSSILSKIQKLKKETLDDIHEKGDRRDYMQVIANGGIALLVLVLYRITNNSIYLVIAAISFAVSNSDTWASEIGVLSNGKTISIITGKQIEKGLSGGISIIGTTAALAGAACIALSYAVLYIIFFGYDNKLIVYIFCITLIGFLGSIIDSILGATIQGHYYDSSLGRITEKTRNNNGQNKKIKGISFINNDIVNLLSNLIACIIAIIILI